MFTNRFATITATLIVAITGTLYADGEDTPAQAVPVEMFPLPANTVFERHVIGEAGTVTTTGERLIYSNTLGTFAAALGANRLVADDIATIAPNGCKLRRLEFPVVGKVNPNGIGGPYSLDFALYSNCPGSVPSASRPGLIIENSAVHLDFPNDGPRLVSFVPSEGTDVVLLTNLWLAVKFSRNNAGPIVGAPAMVGFSADSFDFPGLPCNAFLGGFPDQPHASFNLEIYGDAECPEAFVGYKNYKPSGSIYNPGSGVFLADDIKLGVNECQMIAYEVAIKGVGFYEFDLRKLCGGTAIPGTQKSFSNPLSYGTNVRILQFAFDPPIALPQEAWFAARVNNPVGCVVIAGKQAEIGSTGELLYTVETDTCTEVPPPDLGPGIHGAVNLTITCAGAAPVGACCDMIFSRCVSGPDDGRPCCPENAEIDPFCEADPARVDGYPPCTFPGTCESVCREMPQMNCPWPWPQWNWSDQPQWIEGATCDPDPFPLTCGLAACCRPDQVCENLTQNECNAVEPVEAPHVWRRGRYCGVDGQGCPWMACLPRTGDCHTAHEEPGCQYPECCHYICEADSYCCLVEWDRLCVERANTLCPYSRGHDECSSLHSSISTLPVEADSVTVFSNIGATESTGDPGFCCRADSPGAQAIGTVWFKFVATDTSARVSTCGSDPTGDSLIDVFSVGDPTTEETACATLIPIACIDDVEECGGGTHGRICVQGLMPGDTYYVMVAAKTPETKGLYQLEIRSPCFEEPIWNPNDCNENKLPDGCELGSGTASDCNSNNILDECDIASGRSFDCNHNYIPDECDLTTGVSPDCNANSIPDECDAVIQDCNHSEIPDECDIADGRSPDCQPNGVPDECDVASGTSPDCDGDIVPDECTALRQTLRADPPSNSFGRTMATEGDLLIVGDPEPSGTTGAAYVFRRKGSFWIQEARLTSPEGVPRSFGWSVALANGNAYVVGGTDTNQEGDIAGAVFIFTYDGATWSHQSTLTVSDPSEPKRQLCGVVADGDHIAVSACWTGFITDHPPPAIIYILRRDGSGWVREAKLSGDAVSLHRDRIALGFPYDNTDQDYAVGSVHIHRLFGSQWVFETRLTWPEVYEYGIFGDSLELRGDWLVVGRREGSSCGQQPANPCHEAAIFRHKGDIWSYDGRVADQAGWIWPGTVGFVREGMVVTGAAGGADGATLANVYRRQATEQWTRSAFLKASDGLPKGFIRTVVLGGGDSAIVSVLPKDSQDGDPPATISVFALAASDCNKNEKADSCDLRDGTSADCNHNDAPDECETLSPFDFDFDGDVDLIDLAGFQRCFTGPGPAKLAPCCKVFDFEPDGDVDLADFLAFGGEFLGP